MLLSNYKCSIKYSGWKGEVYLLEIFPMELISDDEKFNVENFDIFAKTKVENCAVVGIIGPQSIGKSTLLNCLFDTNFKEWHKSMEMGAQTTKGLYIAKANREPVFLVMDLEGTDSMKRNEKSFENQIALFALLFADVLLINIGYKDIGKDCAANRPLLRTILQTGLEMESFNTTRKKTLFFVVRDTIPFEEQQMNSAVEKQKKNIVEIWKEVQKPECHENTSLDQFFKVKVFPLPIYPTNENQFKVEVDKLRQEISTSIEEGFDVSGFYKNAKRVWETIKQNPDLNIPSINVLVAFLKCDEVARNKLRHFETDEGWLTVRQEVETKNVSDFGARITSILSKLLSEYDSETKQWKADKEGEVKTEKRQHLKSQLYSVVDPVYITNLSHLRSKQLQSFETELDAALNDERYENRRSSDLMKSCVDEFDRLVDAAKPDHERERWDDSRVRQELIHHIDLRISNKLPQIVQNCQKQLSKNLNQALGRLIDAEEEITWASINISLNGKVNEAMGELRLKAAVLQPEVDENMRNNMNLSAREVVKNKFKVIHRKIQHLMKIRYNKIYSITFNSYKLSNTYNSDEECSSNASKEAYRGCVKFLSNVAVLRFDDTYDEVEHALISSLLDNSIKLSDSCTWETVPHELTLLAPCQCVETWVQFKLEMEKYTSPERLSELTAVTSKAFNWTPIKWMGIALLSIGVGGGAICILRFTNLGLVLLGLLSYDAWVFIADSIDPAIMTVEAAISMFKLLQQLVRNNDVDGFTNFRRKHARIMKHLMKGLKDFLNHVNSMYSRRRSALESTVPA